MMIFIDISEQKLFLKDANKKTVATYPISSAKNGLGEKKNSFQTPHGKHIICEKIGDALPIFSVFHARKPTGEIYSAELAKQFPDCDWILSRILWLSGCEIGKNSGGDVDTKSRYIYIHGTSDENHIGTPQSHGCIRMKNTDVIDLFNRVSVGDSVVIGENIAVTS